MQKLILYTNIQNMLASATREHDTFQGVPKHEASTAKIALQTNAYQAILDSSIPDQDKQPARLAQEILTLLVGGSSTTARVMTRMTYQLLADPALLARLRAELDVLMPDPRIQPPLEQLEQSPYLVSFNSFASFWFVGHFGQGQASQCREREVSNMDFFAGRGLCISVEMHIANESGVPVLRRR